MIGFENDVAAPASIASAGAAFGAVLLALKSDTTFAAVTSASIDFYLINKHA